jgi:AcrR family transcriptional regulator
MNKSSLKLSKGEETRAVILKAALEQASVSGFEWLTIGSLAAETGLSKSGLFAHFGSKEELQIATLDEAMRRFNELVVIPIMAVPRGLKRLTALLEYTMTWTERCELKACPLMMAIHEFDDKKGPVRDAVVEHMQRTNEGLLKSIDAAITNGELAADADAEQISFELFGIISSCYRSHHLFHDKNAKVRARRAFERLFQSYAPAAITRPTRPTRLTRAKKSPPLQTPTQTTSQKKPQPKPQTKRFTRQ